jgi:hypothetical protein
MADGVSGLVEPSRHCVKQPGLWVPAFAGTTQEDSSFKQQTRHRDLAAGYTRGLLSNSFTLQIRGRRESRVRAAPAVSCANCASKNAHEHTGPAEASDFPCAAVYGLYVISPAIRICLSPSSALAGANLTPTLRRQDHTISPSAFRRPRQECHQRPPHPRPALVTLRNAPPSGTGWLSI